MADKADLIKAARRELLLAFKEWYPAAVQAFRAFRVVIGVLPEISWQHFTADLKYLIDKGYVKRVQRENERTPRGYTDVDKRWYTLEPKGVEVADGIVEDPALEI